MNAKDRAFLALYTLGKELGRNLPMEFLERYELRNFAQASAEQMREFCEECTRVEQGEQ